MRMKEKLMAFFREEEGLTTVEYAIAGGLVAGAVILGFGLLGDEVGRIITAIKDALTGVTPGS